MGSADKEMTVTEVLNFLHDVIRLQKSASLDGQVSAEECPPPPPCPVSPCSARIRGPPVISLRIYQWPFSFLTRDSIETNSLSEYVVGKQFVDGQVQVSWDGTISDPLVLNLVDFEWTFFQIDPWNPIEMPKK